LVRDFASARKALETTQEVSFFHFYQKLALNGLSIRIPKAAEENPLWLSNDALLN
jgi:hypothetical protein